MFLRGFAQIVCVLVLSSSAQAQYKFDVKTALEEKQDLHNIKMGLIQAIKESSWASVADVGEDYSLWLSDLRRVHKMDSLYVVVKIEVRTKAMFTRGKLVHGRDVGIRYHWEKSTVHEQDRPEGKEISPQVAQNLKKLMGLSAGLEFVPAGNLLNITPEKASEAVAAMKSITQDNPSLVEVMEALMIGDQALQVVKNMIKTK